MNIYEKSTQYLTQKGRIWYIESINLTLIDMSFSEAFHPDNKDLLKTDEEARYVAGESIDGAAVGWEKPQDKADKTSKNKEESEWNKEEPKQKVVSIDETKAQNELSKIKIKNALAKNPDWPPKSENPESAAAERATLETSLNAYT